MILVHECGARVSDEVLPWNRYVAPASSAEAARCLGLIERHGAFRSLIKGIIREQEIYAALVLASESIVILTRIAS